MPSIGIISVTINAAAPLMAKMSAAAAHENWILRNYLDEGIQDLVQREGGVTSRSIARLMRLVGAAIEDGADAILLTCTVFSPYIDRIQGVFSTLVIGADCAMLEQAARLGKKTAILCTFPAAVETSERLFRSAAVALNSVCDVKTFLLSDAATTLKEGNRPVHDRIIADMTTILAKEYEVIVLAQISMASSVELLTGIEIPVLTSPECAITALKDHFNHITLAKPVG